MIQNNLTNEILINLNKTINIVNNKNLNWESAARFVFTDYNENIKMFKENKPQIRKTEFYYHDDLKEGFFNTPSNKKYLIYMFYKLAKVIELENTELEENT